MSTNRDRLIYFIVILGLVGYIAFLNIKISGIEFNRLALSTDMDGFRIREVSNTKSLKIKGDKILALLKKLKEKPKERIVIKWKEREESGEREGNIIRFDSGIVDLDSLTLHLREYNKEVFVSNNRVIYEKGEHDPDIFIERIPLKREKKISLYLGIDHEFSLTLGISYRFGPFSIMSVGSPNALFLGAGINL